jgi:hypothetical protein
LTKKKQAKKRLDGQRRLRLKQGGTPHFVLNAQLVSRKHTGLVDSLKGGDCASFGLFGWFVQYCF